jgi:hypothetical protein
LRQEDLNQNEAIKIYDIEAVIKSLTRTTQYQMESMLILPDL